MKRYCLALDLINDKKLITQYENWHKAENSWPEITQSIRESGILDMQIYRTGNRLTMIIETIDSFSFEHKGAMDKQNEKVQEWETIMQQFQQPLPWAKKGKKWTLMKNIYSLP